MRKLKPKRREIFSITFSLYVPLISKGRSFGGMVERSEDWWVIRVFRFFSFRKADLLAFISQFHSPPDIKKKCLECEQQYMLCVPYEVG